MMQDWGSGESQRHLDPEAIPLHKRTRQTCISFPFSVVWTGGGEGQTRTQEIRLTNEHRHPADEAST